MRRALQLAKAGRGNVSPNPMVGAVIVSDTGIIIGEGYHRCFGEGHAEVNAVNSVADKAQLKCATLYVTLEPCSHYGKTPPCAELIIRMGIPKVVIGALDPFPKVSGRGVKMLREAGVEVVTGVLENECINLNRRFMTAHRLQRPYIQLKWAQSADGFIDAKRTTEHSTQTIISNPLSSLFMHRERALADAILIGAGTVKLDNPSLSVRRWQCRKQPLRVVLDANLSSPASSQLFTDGNPTLVYNNLKSETANNVEYVKINSRNLQNCLSDLYSRGITSLMVEGGADVLRQFIDADLWDEARIESSLTSLKEGVKAPNVKGTITNKTLYGSNAVKTVQNCVKYLER